MDGLNSVLNAVPTGDSNPLDMFTESGAYPLLNPAVKGAIELGTNQSMDPDFPYPIAGGEYNEMNGISPAESLGIYAARNVSPVAGFLAKLSKNGDLGPLSMGEGDYREEHGYNTSRDIASFLTGAGFYQGTHEPVVPGAANAPAVGKYGLSDIPAINGRKAAAGYGKGPTGDGKTYGSMEHDGKGYPSGDGSGWVNYPDYPQGSGWVNYPDRPWVDYPDSSWVDYGNSGGYRSGGYGGGGSSSGGGGSLSSVGGSSGGGMEFWSLLEALKKMVDQGDVVT